MKAAARAIGHALGFASGVAELDEAAGAGIECGVRRDAALEGRRTVAAIQPLPEAPPLKMSMSLLSIGATRAAGADLTLASLRQRAAPCAPTMHG